LKFVHYFRSEYIAGKVTLNEPNVQYLTKLWLQITSIYSVNWKLWGSWSRCAIFKSCFIFDINRSLCRVLF